MPLINCKVQLNLKRTGHFVLSAAGADNANVNSNSFIFTIKETKLYVSAVTYLQKATKSYQNVLVKSCKDQCIRINLKQKVKIKARQTSAYYFESNFSGVNRFFMLVYSNQDDNPKRYKFWRSYLPKGIIKNYNVIINRKNFYDQPIDTDILVMTTFSVNNVLPE